MAGPIAATGAISNPTRYGALTMGGEQFTGLWTQRSPYRDAATAYLMKKFYQGSRFDSIWDGINREISAKLTDVRRPGSAVYNSTSIDRILSFYAFKFIVNGAEQIHVMADKASDVEDVTGPSGRYTVFLKSAGAGRTRFLGLGPTLYMSDGVDQQKWMRSATVWAPSTAVNAGTLIVDSNNNLQMAVGGLTMNIVATSSNGSVVTIYFDPQTVTNQFANLQGANVGFNGLTGAGSYLNGNTYVLTPISSTLGIATIPVVHASYAVANDTGTGTTGNGITGGTAPAWSTTQYGITADGGQQWKCYGPALQGWGVAAPTLAPTVTPLHGTHFWQPHTAYFAYYSVLDPNGNIQVIYSNVAGGAYTTGNSYPQWSPASVTTPQPTTVDGNVVWKNAGKPGNWAASTSFAFYQCIIDSNQNLQLCIVPGTSGAAPPASWATAPGSSTTDGGVTWVCMGTGVTLTTDSIQYAYSLHGVDGSLSTASPAVTIYGGILGPPAASAPYIRLDGTYPYDTQEDKIYIWRSPQGQLGTLLLEDQIPVDPFSGTLSYQEYGIPDTSNNGSGALSPFIQAPTAKTGDRPPAGFTGMVYHLQRIWGFVGNVVYYSNGPDAMTSASNGNTAFPPLNQITYQAQVIKLWPITVQNGGILVFTTSGIFIILGTGTANNPFYSTQFCNKINLASYDTFDVLGTEIFLMEANGKVSSLQIEYPFNPQSGYTEIGFPIGDQFKKVTTGGFNAALFNPATSYLSWNVQSSGETAMYVADGNGHWFRLSSTSQPETGMIWHPIASIGTIDGTSAVQSVETSPGNFDLLIGPGFAGPILKRDTTGTVWDDNGRPYPSWDAKGVNLLCSTGQWTEVAHISAKSAAVGARPAVSVLLGEIAPSTERPWNVLEVTSPDPASTPRSKSVYSDRYALAQNGVADAGDCILTKFDYGTQAVGDELLDWGIFATTEDERKEEAQK